MGDNQMMKGGRLIALNAPVGMTFGIDAMSYTVGEKFRGVQDIPLGLHFCHYSIGAGDEQQGNGFGGRHGFFFSIKSSYDVIAWTWDASLEDFIPAAASSSMSSKNGLSEGSLANLIESSRRGELDGNLGPYPRDKELLWNQLSDFITVNVIENCGLSVGVKVLPGDPEECMDSDDEMDYEPTNTNQNHTKLVNYFDDQGRVATFPFAEPPLPKLYRKAAIATHVEDKMNNNNSHDVNQNILESPTKPRTATKQGVSLNKLQPSERTTWCIDASERISQIISSPPHNGSWESLLGEIQLAFILFSLNFSFPALKHWKHRIALITSCGDTALDAMPLLFTCLCRCLAAQLEFVPSDFFDVELTSGSFLEPCLRSLFLHISEYVRETTFTTTTPSKDVDFKAEDHETKDFNAIELEQGKDRLLSIVRSRFHLFILDKQTKTGDNSDDEADDDDEEEDDVLEFDIDGGLNQHKVDSSSYYTQVGVLPGFTGFEPEDELPTVVDLSEMTSQLQSLDLEHPQVIVNNTKATQCSDNTTNSLLTASTYFGIPVFIPTISPTSPAYSTTNTPSPSTSPSTISPSQMSLLLNDASLVNKYPTLIAAMQPGEDIIMTARRLIDSSDETDQTSKHVTSTSSHFHSNHQVMEEDEEETENNGNISWVSPTVLDLKMKVKQDALRFLETEVAISDSAMWRQQQDQVQTVGEGAIQYAVRVPMASQVETKPQQQSQLQTPSICVNLGLD